MPEKDPTKISVQKKGISLTAIKSIPANRQITEILSVFINCGRYAAELYIWGNILPRNPLSRPIFCCRLFLPLPPFIKALDSNKI